MCCFSQPVELVSDTSIFARGDKGRQFLVYSMTYSAPSELAMVLPLPVPGDASEDAVQFINLQRYPTFFEDMRRGFSPRIEMLSLSRLAKATSLEAPKLRVHDVGAFEASYVPGIADFDRLDSRFRLPSQVWAQLPEYHDFGFAVFKLKSPSPRGLTGILRSMVGGSSDGHPRTVHPMAFTFLRRNPELLYFPTLHIHDGDVHRHAMFDHMLYCQAEVGREYDLQGWEKSDRPASGFLSVARSQGIVHPGSHCWGRGLEGRLHNHDTVLGKTSCIPGRANLRAAEAVLAEGGTLDVAIDGVPQPVRSVAEIPRRSFRITGVDFSGHQKVTRAFCDSFFGSREEWEGLTTLRLSRSTVTNWGLHELRKLKSLQILWLDQTQITDLAAGFLREMHLKELHLEGTTLSPKAVEVLQRAMPNCSIFR